MAKIGNLIQVLLVCTEAPGTSVYVTTKNQRTHPGRMELRKYNGKLRRHTLHREKK